jgi:hypothetical protein
LRPKPVSPEQALRKVFKTLFLRGRTSQGLTRQTAPTKIAQKLGLILLMYILFGLTALALLGQGTFLLAAYQHGFSFMMVGMFLVQSAGETLFNKEEGDILLHRPVTPRMLLSAKISVLIEVCLYMALAMNAVGLVVGFFASDGNGLYPLIHALTTVEAAIFCASCVVLVYQACLRWFGRERLDNVMTFMQVIVMAAFMIGSQIFPRMLINNVMVHHEKAVVPWWVSFLPPGWFAGLDDAVAGSHSAASWGLGALGLAVTALFVWLSFVRLAKTYEVGVQSLNEAAAPKVRETRQLRLLSKISQISPVSWFLRGSIERMSFVLSGAYLFRDREVKLRVFPSLTSVIIMPIMMAVSQANTHSIVQNASSEFPGRPHIFVSTGPLFSLISMAFAGAFLATVPATALNLMSYSQQWKASEVFRLAPVTGPYALQRGAQVASIVLLAIPMAVLVVFLSFVLHQASALPLALPGIFLVPLYAFVPPVLERAIPLSRASEEARSANRGCLLVVAMFFSMAISGLMVGAWLIGIFWYVVAAEVIVVSVACILGNRYLKRQPWPLLE